MYKLLSAHEPARSIRITLSLLMLAVSLPVASTVVFRGTRAAAVVPDAGAGTPIAALRASVSSNGAQGNSNSGDADVFYDHPDISGDGRYVTFQSRASNLIDNDPQPNNGADDIFVRDMVEGKTKVISVFADGTYGTRDSARPAISGDGRYVAFQTKNRLVSASDYSDRTVDIYVRDRDTDADGLFDEPGAVKNVHVSVTTAGAGATASSGQPDITPDGRFVAFHSDAQLGSGDTNPCSDIYVHDRDTDVDGLYDEAGGVATALVSAKNGNAPFCDSSFQIGSSYIASISDDGRLVAFESSADFFFTNDSDADNSDVFVHDRDADGDGVLDEAAVGATSNFLASPGTYQDDAYASTSYPSISGNGDMVAYWSNFKPSTQTHRRLAMWVTDVSTGGRIPLATFAPQGDTTNVTTAPGISYDGRYVSFHSYDPTLVPGDTNNSADAFVVDMDPDSDGAFTLGSMRTERVSVSPIFEQANSTSLGPVMSSDGAYVAYHSLASNLVANNGDTNATWDVFRSQPGAMRIVVPPGQVEGACNNLAPWIAKKVAACQSDPVNSATGAFESAVTDLALPGLGNDFAFTRSYSSNRVESSIIGKGWTHNWNTHLLIRDNGNVVAVAPSGQRVLFTKRPDGSYRGAPGARSKLTLNGSAYELSMHDQMTYEFDTQGKVTGNEDRNGNSMSVVYFNGKIDYITDTVGRQIDFDTNAGGRVSNIELPDGRSVTYTYTDGLLTAVTDVRGNDTIYAYDAQDRLTKITDQNGHDVVTNVYGTDGRVIEQTDARGKVTTFSWNVATETSTMTDPRGKQWKDVYSDNVLVKQIDPLGNETRFGYDLDLNLVSVTDARGHETTMTYDNKGNLLTRTAPAPLAYQEIWTYNSRNDVTSYEDPRDKITVFSYDSAGNLTGVSREGVSTQLHRDSQGSGLLVGVTDARSKRTDLSYDGAGNMIGIETPKGHVWSLTYDSSGRITGSVDARGNEPGASPSDYDWLYEYNGANQVTKMTDPLGSQTAFAYDPAGNLTSRTDSKSRTTSFGYNPANYLTTVAAPGSIDTSYTYDNAGNLKTRTDDNNHITTYSYDDANRLAEILSPEGQQWHYAYDANGNFAKLTDANGNATTTVGDGVTDFTYDVINRLTAIDYSGTTPDASFTYNANSNLASMIDALGTETYTYDDHDRLTGIARGSETFSYGYDAVGNVTSRTYPDGTSIAYTFDDDSLLDTVASGGATTDYAYDPTGNVVETLLPASNGHRELRAYDRAGRLTEVANKKGTDVLSSFTYILDDTGNPTSVTTPDGVTTYGYDPLDRLESVCFDALCDTLGSSISWTYDGVGNRLSEVRRTATTTYTYDDADRLLTSIVGGTTTNYSHDDNGNMTAAGALTYVYDQANRMIELEDGPATTDYAYDGMGRRASASRVSSGTPVETTEFTWDSNWSLPMLIREADETGALKRRYVHGNDGISMTTPQGPTYYHYDGVGSVTNVTGPGGEEQWSYEYEPFGVQLSSVKQDSSAADNPLRYTGEQLDPTGLYHLRARQYAPHLGMFTSFDTWPERLMDVARSTYGYVNNRPTFFVDPSGLRVEIAHGGGGGIAGPIAAAIAALTATASAEDAYMSSTGESAPPQKIQVYIDELTANMYADPELRLPTGNKPKWCFKHPAICKGTVGSLVFSQLAQILPLGRTDEGSQKTSPYSDLPTRPNR